MLKPIWRPKPYSSLTKEQLDEKFKRDEEYETNVRNLYATLPREQAITQKQKLWNDYLEWAKAFGLYEKVTPEQQLTEAEDGLSRSLSSVNQLRVKLGKPEVEVTEKRK